MSEPPTPKEMTDPNGVSLKEHLEKLIAAQWAAHNQVHIREGEAREIASDLIDKRLMLLNELRADVIRDRDQYARKETVDIKIESISTEIESIQNWRARATGIGIGIGFGSALGGAGLATLIQSLMK